MPSSRSWNGNSYSIPTTGEFNWQSLTGFLEALADNAQTINFQQIAVRVALTSPATVSAATDCVVISNLTSPGAVAVTLPPGIDKQIFYIVDGKGDASTNSVTITPDGAETINGAATYVINIDNGGIGIVYKVGQGWTVFSEFGGASDAGSKIARSKIAAGSANEVIINNGSGFLSSEAQLSQTRGGTGASNTGTLTFGANNIIFATTGATSVTLPLTGTLATLIGSETLENKTLKSPLITSGSIDVPVAGVLAIGATVGANNITIGGPTSGVVIPGDLTIQGTTTTVDTTNLDVKDKNITVNKNGLDATSEGAGLTIDRTGTKGSLIYKDASASKFALGALGAEADIVDVSSTQTLTNKTLSGGTISSSAVGASSLTVSGTSNLNGGTTLGDASGDALTINSSAVSTPNGLNFDSNTLVIDATNNRVGVGVASPTVPLEVSGAAIVGSLTTSSSIAASTDTLDLKPAGTVNSSTFIANNVTASGSVKGVTIATNAASGSTTNVVFGSSVSGAINNYLFSGKQAVQLPAGNNSSERPASPADGMIRYNSTDSTYEGYSTANGGWGALGAGGAKATITQASSFVVGDILYLNGSTYTKAQANASTSAEVVGMVSKIITAGSKYELTLSGLVEGIVSIPPASLTIGSVYFLSDATPGLITTSEPATVGYVSVPLGVAVTANSIYFAPKRGMVVGGANARTQINLANNTPSQLVQNVSAYEAGELAGWVLITNSTPANSKRFYVQAPFAKYGGSADYYISPSYVGDTPPAGFTMTVTAGGLIQVTMPNVSGYASAVINFALNAPAVGTNFPLSVDGTSITGGLIPAANLPLANATTRGAISIFEENTWTASTVNTANLSGTGSASNLSYTRIGNTVFCRIESITGLTTTLANSQTIFEIVSTGLPGLFNGIKYFGSAGIQSIAVNAWITASIYFLRPTDSRIGLYWFSQSAAATINVYGITFSYKI